MSLDLAIMLETVRALVADRQFGVQFANEDTMLGEGSRRVLADLAGEDRLDSLEAPPRERVSSS